MEKVTFLSSLVICLIFVLGFISSYLERHSAKGKATKTNYSMASNAPVRNYKVMNGITTHNGSASAKASLGETVMGSLPVDQNEEHVVFAGEVRG